MIGSNAVCIGNGYITEANGTAVYSGSSVTVSNVASSTVHPTAAPAHHQKSNHHNDSRPLLSTKELILIVSIGGVLLLLVVGLAVRICLTQLGIVRQTTVLLLVTISVRLSSHNTKQYTRMCR